MEIRLVKISRVILAVLFIFSAISKLISLPFFDGLVAELLIGKDYYNHYDALWYTQLLTRLIISGEFVLGFAVLQETHLKKIVIPTIQLMLLVFTIHLFYEGFSRENGFTDGNCGCFGDVVPMNNLESIIKNVLAMLLAAFVWKYHATNQRHRFASWVGAVTLGIVCMVTLWLTVKNYKPVETEEKPMTEVQETTLEEQESIVVKSQADSLVQWGEFKSALALVDTQVAKDTSFLNTHSEYIKRLREVVEIEKIKK